MRGQTNDGNNYVNDALVKGAAVIVSEFPQPDSVPHIIVENIRGAIGIMASNFYGNPHKKLKIIAVIGTNGKTTTANMIGNILISAAKTAIFGTLARIFWAKSFHATLPPPTP